jgi:hypothetical protein
VPAITPHLLVIKPIARLALLSLLAIGVAHGAEAPLSAPDPTAQIRQRADSLLDALRSAQWDRAAQFVIVVTGKKDAVTRGRMGISRDATAEAVAKAVGDWFKQLYGTVRPGRVVSVHLNPRDGNLALVTYKHDDLDGFYMRRVDGGWYYTLDETPDTGPPVSAEAPRR